jgi:hypothetical protein
MQLINKVQDVPSAVLSKFASSSPLVTVEEKLDYLKHWGDVSLSWITDSWYSKVDMNVNAAGVQFKVDSGFKNVTQSESLDKTIERMKAALIKLGVDADKIYKSMS